MNRCPSTLPSWECLKNSAFLQRAACPTTYIFLLNSNLLLPHGRLLVPSLFLLAAADLHPPKWSHSRHPLCKLISCIWQVLTKCCAQAPGSVPGTHGTETKTETVPGPLELTIQYERQVGVHKKPGSPRKPCLCLLISGVASFWRPSHSSPWPDPTDLRW